MVAFMRNRRMRHLDATRSMTGGDKQYFVTVDAESVCIPEGVETIDALRADVERAFGIAIPIVWFVRFQRNWNDDMAGTGPAHYEAEPQAPFDGFAQAEERFRSLQERGDEIGWHYHAHSYVHKTDLSHTTRIAMLDQDLRACARAIRRCYATFDVRSFRFGWFFVPDYRLYRTLSEVGIEADASTKYDDERQVATFDAKYLPPIPALPRDYDGVRLFPHRNVILIHDWNVVVHEVSWRKYTQGEARRGRDQFKAQLQEMASAVVSRDRRFATYRSATAQ